MASASEGIVVFVGNAVWQIPLILAIAVAAVRALRAAPARYRLRVWTAALLVSLAVPLGSALDLTSLASGRASVGWSWSTWDGDLPAPRALSGVAAVLGDAGVDRGPLLPPGLLTLIALAYLCLTATLGVRLVRAWRRTAAIARAALPAPPDVPAVAEAFARCRRVLGAPPVPLLCSPDVAGPAVVGSHRPVILAPPSLFRETAPDRLVGALGHELAHVVRRDCRWNLVLELCHLLLAFHPAAWYLRRRLRFERELACDELVTEHLLTPDAYARVLVGHAEGLVAVRPVFPYGLAVFETHNLEERVMKIIDRPRSRAPWIATILSSAAFVALLTVGVAATALSFQLGTASAAATPPSAARAALIGSWHVPGKAGARIPPGEIIVRDETGKLTVTAVEFFLERGLHDPNARPGQSRVEARKVALESTKLSFEVVLDVQDETHGAGGTAKFERRPVRLGIALAGPGRATLSDLGVGVLPGEIHLVRR